MVQADGSFKRMSPPGRHMWKLTTSGTMTVQRVCIRMDETASQTGCQMTTDILIVQFMITAGRSSRWMSLPGTYTWSQTISDTFIVQFMIMADTSSRWMNSPGRYTRGARRSQTPSQSISRSLAGRGPCRRPLYGHSPSKNGRYPDDTMRDPGR